MKAILTSALGGYIKTADGRIPDTLLEANGLLDTLRFLWKADSKVMIICGSPDNHDKNDSILSCLRAAFPMSGLSIAEILMCDGRNRESVDRLPEMDVLVLAGGHVPTQNAFMKELRLK